MESLTVCTDGGSTGTGAVFRYVYCGIVTAAEFFPAPVSATVVWLVVVQAVLVLFVTGIRHTFVAVRCGLLSGDIACVIGSIHRKTTI